MTTAIQAWEIVDLPLHRLLVMGRKVVSSNCHRSLRIAVLGDAATQHYCQALSAILKLRGVWPEVYEAEFDMIRQEILNPDSGLYRHEPEAIVLFTCVQALSSRFVVATDKSCFAENSLAELLELWAAIRKRSNATIIQHNFAIPPERPFGNQTILYPEAFGGAVFRLNTAIAREASTQKVRLVDTEFQSALYGKLRWFDERLWCQAKQGLAPAFLPPLAKSVSDVLLVDAGHVVKCVIVDLDNTMWGGVLGDDGPDGIEIGQTEVGLVFLRFQHALLELKNRGVLLAIQSKNYQKDVIDVLDNHPDIALRAKDFVVIVANHEDKVTGIKAIQKRLNIGFDSFVFLDDSAFERNMVRIALPDVQVPELPEDPAELPVALARWHLFEGRVATAEDHARLEFYRSNEQRDALKANYDGIDAYLASLEMQAEVRGFDPYTLPRALQLVQRSNQFNLTTIRYGETELRALADDPNVSAFTIRLTDRLGDNGIIGLVILRRQESGAVIDTWIMSCRVLARRVEEFTRDLMVERARAMGATRLIGRFVPTSKNSLVADLYPRLGFAPVPGGHEGVFALDLEDYTPPSNPIRIVQ
jgi:FkbH-like protein